MTRYSWPNFGQDEQSVASGRLADQLRAVIGLSGYSLPAARDAALAEVLGRMLDPDAFPTIPAYLTQVAAAKFGAPTAFPSPPPAPMAVAPQGRADVDVIAHWYNDFGLRVELESAVGSIVWYDWSWLWSNGPADATQRTPSLGYYHGDDPSVLNWQAHWLRRAGITGACLVSSNLSTASWTTPTDPNYWIYQLMVNAPNFKGLQYILWGQYAGTSAEIAAQWADMVNNVYLQYRNFYCVRRNGKLYPVIYVFEAGTLFTNLGGTDGAHLTFLQTIASLFRAAGYGGVAIFARHAKADVTSSRATYEASDILYFAADYSGTGGWLNLAGTAPVPVQSDALTYDAGFSSWVPLHEKPEWVVTTAYLADDIVRRNGWLYICRVNHTSAAADTPGEGKNQSTNWFKLGPINREVVTIPTSRYAVSPHPSAGATYYKMQGPTPSMFRRWLERAIDSVLTSGAAPIVMIYNVAEFAEGGPGLQGNLLDGFGFLESIQAALGRSRLRLQSGVARPTVTETIQPVFIVAASTLPNSFDRLKLDVDANRVLTATPTIATAGALDGQRIELVNVNASFTVTLQDRGTLPSSALYLSAGTIVLGQWDSIVLEYDSALGGWRQISQVNVL